MKNSILTSLKSRGASGTTAHTTTQAQHAACLNVGMNRCPNLYRISRFDIRINEKFDINITKIQAVGKCVGNPDGMTDLALEWQFIL